MKFLVSLLPRSRREWGRALLAESEHAEKPAIWRLGGIRLVGWSWFDWMIGGNLMKTVVTALSIVNIVLGGFLVGIFVSTGSDHAVVLLLGIGLMIQGGFTIWYLTGPRKQPWATHALLAGQTVAFLVGVGGFVISVLNNINPTGGDYEYGPIAVGGMIAVHAATTLYLYAIRNVEPSGEAPTAT